DQGSDQPMHGASFIFVGRASPTDLLTLNTFGGRCPPYPDLNASRPTQNTGITTCAPFFSADSWAQRPTIVQFAEVSASGSGGRSPRMALSQAWTKCGCEPPWPPPWMKLRCCSSSAL